MVVNKRGSITTKFEFNVLFCNTFTNSWLNEDTFIENAILWEYTFIVIQGGIPLEEIIRRILAADLAAQEKLQNAEETSRQVLKQVQLDKVRVEEEVWNAAKHFVEHEKGKLAQQLFAARQEQTRAYAASLVTLEESFAKQRETWRKEILERCLNQE